MLVHRKISEGKTLKFFEMKHLEPHQKYAVLHCAFQVIASADGSIDEERDYEAISFLLAELGFSSVYAWDSALKINPHDAFYHVSMLDNDDKIAFKNMMLKISAMAGNEKLRKTCAESVFELCGILI